VADKLYQFGEFRLDAAGKVLFRGEERIPLTPKVVDTLLLLVESSGSVVDKDELMKRVWPDTFVEEISLTRNISVLRKTLGDGDEGREFIETIPKRGYRFVAQVKEPAGAESSSITNRVMLAVLPFENLGGRRKHDYFSDGLTEEMITHLARLNPQRLGVIARTSAMQYRSTGKGIQQIGRELSVSYVLEGSVRRAGHRLRITAQLIQVHDESHLWAENYDRDFGDILALQSEVAEAIARQIQVKLPPRERGFIVGAGAIDPQAYELYLKGRYFWYKRTEEGLRKGIACFQQAIEQDPNYAASYAGLSDSYVLLACRGVVRAKEALIKAKAAAQTALQKDAALGEAYASLAHIRLHDWDWVGLEDDFQRALELNPGHSIAYFWYAEYLRAMGRAEESVALVNRARQIDPLSPVTGFTLAMAFYSARRYDQALEHTRQVLEIDPSHFLVHLMMGNVCIQSGIHEEAIRAMRTAVDLSGRSTEALAGLGRAYAGAGRREAAQEVLDQLEQRSKDRYVSPYFVAKVCAALQDKGRAFDWLEKAYEERNPNLIELKMEPVFDSLRTDPRFAGLLRRVGWRD
jgi:TolB-like protein/Tfp pilus assembly protein PilF